MGCFRGFGDLCYNTGFLGDFGSTWVLVLGLICGVWLWGFCVCVIWGLHCGRLGWVETCLLVLCVRSVV